MIPFSVSHSTRYFRSRLLYPLGFSRLGLCRTVASAGKADPSNVDARNAPSDFDPLCAVVYPKYLDPREADILVEELSKRMKRYLSSVVQRGICRCVNELRNFIIAPFFLLPGDDMNADTGMPSLPTIRR